MGPYSFDIEVVVLCCVLEILDLSSPSSHCETKTFNGEFHVDSFCQRITIYQRLIHSVSHFEYI